MEIYQITQTKNKECQIVRQFMAENYFLAQAQFFNYFAKFKRFKTEGSLVKNKKGQIILHYGAGVAYDKNVTYVLECEF